MPIWTTSKYTMWCNAIGHNKIILKQVFKMTARCKDLPRKTYVENYTNHLVMESRILVLILWNKDKMLSFSPQHVSVQASFRSWQWTTLVRMGKEEQLTHLLGQQVHILLIATLRSIVKLYQGESLEKQRHACWRTFQSRDTWLAKDPLQPTTVPPQRLPAW